MRLDEPRVHRWTRNEYYKMGEIGLFEGKRVELIAGEIIEMSPMASPHATAVTKAVAAFFEAFGREVVIRPQLPLSLAPHSEPEPDIAVVSGTIDDYRHRHPDSALLIVEVSDSTLPYDRSVKASLYAAAGIGEYWIINLPDHRLEVHRNPQPAPAQPQGYGYTTREIVEQDGTVTPLFAPHTSLQAANLLP